MSNIKKGFGRTYGYEDKKQEMFRKLIEFAIEVKKLVANTGRSSMISKYELDSILIKYCINLKELEDEMERNKRNN